MNTTARFSYLLKKYLANTCLPSERDELFEMLNNPAHEEVLTEIMQESWNNTGSEKEDLEVSTSELFEIIKIKKSAHLKVSRPSKKSNKWYWVAASLIACIGVSFLLFLSEENSSSNSDDRIVHIANIGELKTIILPDSSTVWLNAGSSIEFSKEFESRSVALNGEAFFDVKRDSLRQFNIVTGEVTALVLGTSFNIRSYKEEKEIKVTVTTGKVGVGKKDLPIASLLPNQQISYQKEAGDFLFNEVDAASLSSWKEGNLVFENVTFDQAAVTLNKRYGYDFYFDNEALKGCRFTSKFDWHEDMEHVLEVLSKLNGISWRQENGKVYFIGTKCL